MEQTKALNALEPFLALTKSATSSRAAADLIQRATSAPNTFIFTELLNAAPIAALAQDAEFAPHYTHLQLFAHGLYATYQEQSSGLPPLNPAQQLKLRQLSLLTLSRDKTQLTYPNLQTQLGLSSTRELEDVVISAVYAGLLTAKLNPIRQEVQVSSVAPLRDVPGTPASVSALVSTLQQWSARCDATLAELEGTVSRIRADAARAAEQRRENEQLVTGAMEAAAALKEAESSGGVQGGARRLRTSNNNQQRSSHMRQQMGASTGGGSASSGGGGSQVGAGGAKRGSEKLMEATTGADDDDEAMDLDDDGDGAGQKKASRRKL